MEREETEENIFCIIERFINRLKPDEFSIKTTDGIRLNNSEDELIITDKAKGRIAKQLANHFDVKEIGFTKKQDILFGCVSRDEEEIDGNEFQITTLKELIDLLKENKELHLNYFEDEQDLDMWLRTEGKNEKL